jgi:hypothetical protein
MAKSWSMPTCFDTTRDKGGIWRGVFTFVVIFRFVHDVLAKTCHLNL